MKRILIVDDEQNIREVLKEYLEFNGFEVITATTVTKPSICASARTTILSSWIS